MTNSNKTPLETLKDEIYKIADTEALTPPVSEIKALTYMCIYQCPSKNGPISSKKFKDYGIEKKYFDILKSVIKNELNIKDENFECFPSAEECGKHVGQFIKTLNKRIEPVLFFKKGENELGGLYVRLRNVFAHGNFCQINCRAKKTYILWDKSGENPSGFLILTKAHIKKLYECLEIAQVVIEKRKNEIAQEIKTKL